MNLDWLNDAVRACDLDVSEQAKQHQLQLTKPPGALGQLESVAVRLAAMQGSVLPRLERINITVFAADHGIAVEGVSAFPQVVTGEMVKNFSRGGAAICVLAKKWGADLDVVNAGTVNPLDQLAHVLDCRIASGTANFAKGPAMTEQQLAQAMQLGHDAIQRAQEARADCFIAGEMGIANTSSATAIAATLLQIPAATLTGPGTGLDADGVSQKARIIEQALQLHQLKANNPVEVLRTVGGFEIAAMVGAYIRAAQVGMPCLVDGFISSAAALVAVKINPLVNDWLIYSHSSAEPGHQKVLAALDARPLLNLGMRLGEGSGAAVALPLLQAACALHCEMATFAQAGVSDKT